MISAKIFRRLTQPMRIMAWQTLLLKTSDHGGRGTIKEQIRNCLPREKSVFENPENRDIDWIRIYVSETDSDRREIGFCVEK